MGPKMVKLFLLGLAFVVFQAKADVSHLATNEYLPPEQPTSITHESPSYPSKEGNFNVPPPPSASSTPIQQTVKEYQPRLAQIESIRPSIHIASFSVRTTVPFPQTYSHQQPTQSSETKQTSTLSYNPQAHIPQTPEQQYRSPSVYTPQEYASVAPVSQQQAYPRPIQIPAVSSKPEHQYQTSSPPINHDPQAVAQQTQQNYDNYRVNHHSLVPSSPVQQNFLPPTQSSYTPQSSHQQTNTPTSSSHYVYSSSPVLQAPLPQAPPQMIYSAPVPKQQDYSTPTQVQQNSFAPEVAERTFSSQTLTQSSYQHHTYTPPEPVQQTSENLQYSPPSYPHQPTEPVALPPAQPQQNYFPSTYQYPKTSEISTSNNVQQSYEHHPSIQKPLEVQSPSHQQYISSTNTQSTSGQPQPTYKSNSSPDQVQQTYTPPTTSETQNSNRQFGAHSNYNYHEPSPAFQQQTYSPPTPEHIQQSYLPPAPVKPMNSVYSAPSHLQPQFVQGNQHPYNQLPPTAQPKPLEPVYSSPTNARESHSSAIIRPQQTAVPPFSGSYNDNTAQVPLNEHAPKIISSYQPIYEAPVPSQLALSYEVSSSSPVVEPYTYNTPTRNIQAPAHLATVETHHSQDSKRQLPISDASSYSYRAPVEQKSQSAIQSYDIQNSPSQTIPNKPESSSQALNKPQQVQNFGSYKYEHSTTGPQTYQPQAPRETFNIVPQPVVQSQSHYSYRAPVSSTRNMETKPRDVTTDATQTTKISAVEPFQKTLPSLPPEAPRSAPHNGTEYGSNGGYIYRRQ